MNERNKELNDLSQKCLILKDVLEELIKKVEYVAIEQGVRELSGLDFAEDMSRELTKLIDKLNK